MNRRDFLSLRVTRHGSVLELSCHGLYMRYLDAQAGLQSETEPTVDYEPWMGEPPARLVKPSADALFSQIEEDLRRVQWVRVLESDWLGSTGLGDRLAPLLASFRDRGGRVELVRTEE